MRITEKSLQRLINGKVNFPNNLSKKISIMIGTSVEIWQNLQNTCDWKLIEI